MPAFLVDDEGGEGRERARSGSFVKTEEGGREEEDGTPEGSGDEEREFEMGTPRLASS
jgi:hypothetical protein